MRLIRFLLIIVLCSWLAACGRESASSRPVDQGKDVFAEARAALEGRKAPSIKREIIPFRKAVLPDVVKPETKGLLKIPLVSLRDGDKTKPVLVSSGIPFAQGQLASGKDVSFFKENGEEIPVAVRELAFWPDGSVRSLLVQFSAVIPGRYEYIAMAWGRGRTLNDLDIVGPAWELPEGVMMLPSEWLCSSGVVGPQVPFGQKMFPGYDDNIERNIDAVVTIPWKGTVRDDLYYDLPHVLYQLYVRTANLKYFLQARKEFLYYRDKHVIHQGQKKGQTTEGENTRYMFVQAMTDDYLLTGDPKSLEAAREMAEYMKKAFSPEKAFFAKHRTNFWTERLIAFPLINFMSYYKISGDKEYLDLSGKVVENLYKTQMQWPERGGFIHNLYAHDPEEGARQDEYGGSPFMTGLLLEGIVEYHRVTLDDTAADSIFRALDWIVNEGLGTGGDALKYSTADVNRTDSGQPDLNMLAVHAFGYGYMISGYKERRYLDTGIKLFEKGISSAYLSRRKHFAQNYRSSGHFLGYLANARTLEKAESAPQPIKQDLPVLLYENFESFSGGFKLEGPGQMGVDTVDVYLGNSSLKVSARLSEVTLTSSLSDWSIIRYPVLSFAYKVPQGMDIALKVKTGFDDQVIIALTSGSKQEGVKVAAPALFVDDNTWHEMRINVLDAMKSVLPGVKELKGMHFVIADSGNDQQAGVFHMDELKVFAP